MPAILDEADSNCQRQRCRRITRQICTIADLYCCAVEEELLDHSLAAQVRRPRLDYDSHAALDRTNSCPALAPGVGSLQDHALISLLALNGLRIRETLGGDITAIGSERGHRTPTMLGKAGKIVTIPPAPRTTRSLDRSISRWRRF